VELGLLAQTAEPAKRFSEWSGSRSWLIKIEDIEACEKAAIEPYVPRPQRGPSVRAGPFHKDEFSYDPTSDSFRAPQVNVFTPIHLLSCVV
jgi:hypothetical protein